MRKFCWCFNKLNSRPEFVMSCILRKRFFSFVYFGCFLSYDFSIDSCYYYYYCMKHLVCFRSANARFMYYNYTSKRVLHIHFVDLSYYVFQVYKVSFDSSNISLHVSFLAFVLFFSFLVALWRPDRSRIWLVWFLFSFSPWKRFVLTHTHT